MGKTTAERFWAKAQIGKPDDCWEWQGSRNPRGYGRFDAGVSDGSGIVRAHRWVYTNEIGQIPQGHGVLHRCDNPPCVNPRHLFSGTHRENMQDMFAKGRGNTSGLVNESTTGELNPAAKLSDQQIAEIRAMYQTGRYYQREVAALYGIDQSYVSLLVRNINRRSPI